MQRTLRDITNVAAGSATASGSPRKSSPLCAPQPNPVSVSSSSSGTIAAATGDVVVPISPSAAKAELGVISARIQGIHQGLEVWMCQERDKLASGEASQDSERRVAAAAAEKKAAEARLWETQQLLREAHTMEEYAAARGNAYSLHSNAENVRPDVPMRTTHPCPRPAQMQSAVDDSIFAPPRQVSQYDAYTPSPASQTFGPAAAPMQRFSSNAAVSFPLPSFPQQQPQQQSHPAGYPSSRPLPRPSSASSSSCFVRRGNESVLPRSTFMLIVEFKRQRMRRCFSDVHLMPGAYVIVPGDRGLDCGLVIQSGLWNQESSDWAPETVVSMDSEPVDIEDVKGDTTPIIREATAEEVRLLFEEQPCKERLALKTCRELVQNLALPMNVVDCEYQFDGNKVSFYFEAEHPVDFRELTKELYRIFNARIWLENVNPGVAVVPAGALSRAEKAYFRRMGCPQNRAN